MHRVDRLKQEINQHNDPKYTPQNICTCFVCILLNTTKMRRICKRNVYPHTTNNYVVYFVALFVTLLIELTDRQREKPTQSSCH